MGRLEILQKLKDLETGRPHDESWWIWINHYSLMSIVSCCTFPSSLHLSVCTSITRARFGLNLRMKALPSAVSCASQEFAVDMSWPAVERMGRVSSRMTHLHMWCLTLPDIKITWVKMSMMSESEKKIWVIPKPQMFHCSIVQLIRVDLLWQYCRCCVPSWQFLFISYLDAYSARPWQFFQSNSWSLQMLPPHEFRCCISPCWTLSDLPQ